MMINERIRYIRKKENLSQEKLAQILDITRASVANYESGRNKIPKSFIKLFCQEMNINEDWLINGDGNPENPHPCGELCLASLFADLTMSNNVKLRRLMYKVGLVDGKHLNALETILDGLIKL